MSIGTTLSQQQQAVIDWVHYGRGSANIVARAGCGKTFLLVEVVKELVSMGERGIFFGAYNKDAGNEIKARLEQAGVRRGVFASTMHAAGLRAWRYNAPGVEIDGRKMHKILDAMWPEKRDEKGKYQPNPTAKRYGAFVLKLVSMAKQHGAGFLWNREHLGKWHELVERYDIDMSLTAGLEESILTRDDQVEIAVIQGIDYARQALVKSIEQDHDVIDFDDMIFAPLYHEAKFYLNNWVLVDEAQDTNPARRALALAMLKPGGRLIAVGDDRQAIYGFTGADADAMELIQHEMGSTVFPLNVTYRCPKAVVAEANKWVDDLTAHESAPQGLVDPEVDYDEFLGVGRPDPADDAVVLCRNNAPLVEIAYHWLRKGIPCVIEGRDLTGSLVQIMRKWDSIKTIARLETKLAEFYKREIKAAAEDKRGARQSMLEDQYATIRVLIAGARDQKMTRVDELVKFTQDMFGDIDTDKPVIKLCSIHKSKGREWQYVYVLGAERYQPSKYARKPEEILQEQNLMYVAATRAKEQLIYVDAKPLDKREDDGEGSWG